MAPCLLRWSPTRSACPQSSERSLHRARKEALLLIGIERFIFGHFSKMPRPVRVFTYLCDRLERKFGFRIPDEHWTYLNSVGELVDYVQKREAYRSRAGEPGSRPVFKR